MPQSVGLVFKCQLMQKWTDFVHQAGPYVLGCNGKRVQAHDVALTAPMWLEYQALWLKHGEIAYNLAKLIHEAGTPETELNIASQLNGPIRFPTALAAELFWSTREPYADILQRVLHRPYMASNA